MNENANPEQAPSTDVQFAELATQLQNTGYEKTFSTLVASYVAKIAAMKMIAPAEHIEPAMAMGQWFLIETAQVMFSLTYDQAIYVTRQNIQAARQALKHAA